MSLWRWPCPVGKGSVCLCVCVWHSSYKLSQILRRERLIVTKFEPPYLPSHTRQLFQCTSPSIMTLASAPFQQLPAGPKHHWIYKYSTSIIYHRELDRKRGREIDRGKEKESAIEKEIERREKEKEIEWDAEMFAADTQYVPPTPLKISDAIKMPSGILTPDRERGGRGRGQLKERGREGRKHILKKNQRQFVPYVCSVQPASL